MDDDQDQPLPGEATPGYQVKAKAILLTYNTLPDEINIERIANALIAAPFIEKTYRWSICLEQGARVHAHAYLEGRKQYDCSLSHFTLVFPPESDDGDAYESVPGDCQSNTVTGSGFRPAANRGHFYVQNKYKNTHIAERNNYEAGKDFSVKTEWIRSQWEQQKIDDDKILPGAGYYRCCTPALEATVRHSVTKRRKEVKAEKRAERLGQLSAMKKPHKQYPVIDKWLTQYQHVEFRYKFLILWGDSRTGKTELARSLFKSPFEHRDSVCWNDYDEEKHDAIIFDDVTLAYSYISENRSLFQAGGWVTVQTSATNVFAIEIDVTQKPIVITTNSEPRGSWILANSVTIHITEPTYEQEITQEVRDAVDHFGPLESRHM